MIKNTVKFVCLVLAAILVLVGCGGGGSVTANNNSLLSGTYFIVLLGGDTSGSPQSLAVDDSSTSGTVTFNGDGSGTDPATDPFNYLVLTDNSFTFDDFVGQVSTDGNFFVATDAIDDGDVQMIFGVKQTSGADATLIDGNYTSTEFSYHVGSGTSTAQGFDWVVDNNAQEIDYSRFFGAPLFYLPGYAIAGDGSITLSGDVVANGQVSPAGQIIITADTDPAEPEGDSIIAGSLALAIPAVSMSDADLNGTYALHQFMDEAPGINGGSFMVTRSDVVFDGSNTGGPNARSDASYTETASSTGACAPNCTGSLSYDVDTDGLFTMDDNEPGGADSFLGMMLQDGSVIAFLIDDTVFIGVKKP